MERTSITVIRKNAELARKMALSGEYDSACIRYEQLQSILGRKMCSIKDPLRRNKWDMIKQEFSKEYTKIKAIQSEAKPDLQKRSLYGQKMKAEMKRNKSESSIWFGSTQQICSAEPEDQDNWSPQKICPLHPKDPDVWSPPPILDNPSKLRDGKKTKYNSETDKNIKKSVSSNYSKVEEDTDEYNDSDDENPPTIDSGESSD